MAVRSFILEPLLNTLVNTDGIFSLAVVNYKCAVSLTPFQHLDSSARRYLRSGDTGASCHACFSIHLGGAYSNPVGASFDNNKNSERKHRYFLLTHCDFIFTRATTISKYWKLIIENKIHSFNSFKDV